MVKKLKDITAPPDLKKHGEGTGAVKKKHPVYADMLPPCNHACPVGENIQAWIAFAQAGAYESAWQKIMEDNPMPAVSGRVCYHSCEDHCNRLQIDSPVSIHAIERFLGDEALQKGWQIKPGLPTGKRVLIVGAGPGGLSAAYHLSRLGHFAEIREAGPVAGGMMHFGIPAYRLPRTELEQEVDRIQKMGVAMVFNHKVEDIIKEKEEGYFDAAFLAIGTQLSHKIDIPGRDAGKILDALSFLKQVEAGNAPKLGRRVAIYGGGNTAMDAARTAKRLGVSEAVIIYRRDREHMAAHDFEAGEALEEGIKINWLRTIKGIGEDELQVEVMKLVNGQPVPTGQFETLEADNLILALGQDADTGFLKNIPGLSFSTDGTLIVGPEMMTGYPGLFAGGDLVPGERSVTVAIGHGKKAARYIDGYLKNNPYQAGLQRPVVSFEQLHRWYMTSAPQKEQDSLPPAQRTEGFNEIWAGLTEEAALFEAQRCLSCGNCFECDGCFGACPEDAVIKLGKGKGYAFDYQRCTGCGVCYEQCPVHAIEMVKGL
jgi:NADPH-dependent glutamate synthase beta subunit-like oxidoreductase